MDDIEHAAAWIAAQDERIAELREQNAELREAVRKLACEAHRVAAFGRVNRNSRVCLCSMSPETCDRCISVSRGEAADELLSLPAVRAVMGEESDAR